VVDRFFVLVGGFLAVFAEEGALVVLAAGFESEDFILAALFLWIIFFLTALSIAENASLIFLEVFCFFAALIIACKVLRKSSFCFSRFLSRLNFLIADFITGISVLLPVQGNFSMVYW